ncbi:hypothetical protein OC834_007479, partial [Tilletia horrida]
MDDLGQLFSQSSNAPSASSARGPSPAVLLVSTEKKSKKASPAKRTHSRAETAAPALSYLNDLGQLFSQSSGGPSAFSGAEPGPAVLPVSPEKKSKKASPAKHIGLRAGTAAPVLGQLFSQSSNAPSASSARGP